MPPYFYDESWNDHSAGIASMPGFTNFLHENTDYLPSKYLSNFNLEVSFPPFFPFEIPYVNTTVGYLKYRPTFKSSIHHLSPMPETFSAVLCSRRVRDPKPDCPLIRPREFHKMKYWFPFNDHISCGSGEIPQSHTGAYIHSSLTVEVGRTVKIRNMECTVWKEIIRCR